MNQKTHDLIHPFRTSQTLQGESNKNIIDKIFAKYSWGIFLFDSPCTIIIIHKGQPAQDIIEHFPALLKIYY